jgi:hypothetical protein
MSRHRTALQDYDGYDDDYDEYYDEDYEEDEYSQQYAPPRQTGGVMFGDFVSGSLKTKDGDPVYAFYLKAKEVLGAEYVNSISETELTSIFYMFDGNTESAMAYLLEKYASVPEPPSKPATVSTPPGFGSKKTSASAPPPGFSTPQTPPLGKQSSSTKKSTGIASGGSERKKGASTPTPPSISANSSTPVDGSQPPPLNKSLSRVQGSDLPKQNTLSRSSSRSGITTSSSSGQLSRAAALSDDELDPEGSAEAAQTNSKPHLTMVVAGHVDAGKSTLVGNLLHQIGIVNSRTIHKYERNAQAAGKSSFFLAWVMDESESEREHGVTIGVAER